MGIRIKDNAVRDAAGKRIDTGSDHADAVRAARDRSSASPSVGLRPTAYVTAALDFEDAQEFVEVVDPKAHRVQLLTTEVDPAVIGEILETSDEDIVENAQRETVLAKPAGAPFDHGNRRYSERAYVVLRASKTVEAYEPEDFEARFVSPARYRRPKGKAEEAMPKALPPKTVKNEKNPK